MPVIQTYPEGTAAGSIDLAPAALHHDSPPPRDRAVEELTERGSIHRGIGKQLRDRIPLRVGRHDHYELKGISDVGRRLVCIVAI
ncbi:MAG: hypothetical protein GEV06_28660 [Luteitalea sp.]|nr:hypothetical protein [Luteitalea sp.]